jgi:hypothetical protein
MKRSCIDQLGPIQWAVAKQPQKLQANHRSEKTQPARAGTELDIPHTRRDVGPQIVWKDDPIQGSSIGTSSLA